jgi:hypothetical protein
MKKQKLFLTSLLLLSLISCGNNSSSLVTSLSNSSSWFSSSNELTSSSEETSSNESLSSENTSSLESSSSDNEEDLMTKYLLKTKNSIVADPTWKQGFALKSVEANSTAHVETNLDYDGSTTSSPYWQMAQWWAPEEYNFKDAEFSTVDEGVYSYVGEARSALIDTNTGSFQMQLDSGKEYEKRFGTPEKESGASWSHFLLEETFPDELCTYVANLSSLTVKFDFSINYCTYDGIEKTDYSNECASFLFYLRLYNRPYDYEEGEEVGVTGTNMWFGIPLFDTRYDYVPSYKSADVGFEGATGSLIYSLDSKNYLNEKIVYEKTYHVEIDALEYIKEAFVYGAQNNYLPNVKWKYLRLNYLNVGWEIPSAYNVSSTFSNLDVIAEY